MKYSVGGYGVHTPNYWKIQKFGGGDWKNCNEANQFCYVCEPPSEGTNLTDFQIFPELNNSKAFVAATQYVNAGHNKSIHAPVWNYDMVAGQKWTDKNTSVTVTVPGNPLYVKMGRDPYEDFITLARDLGATGVDLDYEEFWHGTVLRRCGFAAADTWLPLFALPVACCLYAIVAIVVLALWRPRQSCTARSCQRSGPSAQLRSIQALNSAMSLLYAGDYFKYGDAQGPWILPQTAYKWTAIAKTLMTHIQNIYPDCLLTTAAPAVGAWETAWWGGNLKGLMYWVKSWYPEVLNFLTKGKNAGGINVMTYDLRWAVCLRHLPVLCAHTSTFALMHLPS